MEKTILKAEKRDKISKGLFSLRKKQWIPAILYGNKTPNIPLQIYIRDFNFALKTAGQSSLVDLSIGEENPIKTIIHDVQYDPKTGEVIHADIYKVDMNKKIRTEVPIKPTGEAPAVKDLEGSLIINLNEIEIECLPSDLINEIEIDISNLKTFEDKILVKDLNLSENIEVLNDKEETIALVNPPRSEEELEELDEQVEENVEDVEVTTEKKEAEEGENAETETTSKEAVIETPTEQTPEVSKTEEK